MEGGAALRAGKFRCLSARGAVAGGWRFGGNAGLFGWAAFSAVAGGIAQGYPPTKAGGFPRPYGGRGALRAENFRRLRREELSCLTLAISLQID